jgi:cell division protein FtsB
MINLIPPQAKKQMKREYWLRVSVTWLLLLCGVLVVFGGLLVPSFVLIDSQLRAFEQQAASATAAASEQEGLKDEIATANREAAAVLALGTVPKISPYLQRIEALRGGGITLNQVRVIRTDSVVTEIEVSGVAASRETLTAFSSRLADDDWFTKAPVPFENLAANEDIGFVIPIGVAPQL